MTSQDSDCKSQIRAGWSGRRGRCLQRQSCPLFFAIFDVGAITLTHQQQASWFSRSISTSGTIRVDLAADLGVDMAADLGVDMAG